MKISDSQTKWAKIGRICTIASIGKDILFFGAGCHLKFFNIATGQETIYTANNRDAGDGVKCYTGHRTQNIFAFIENRPNPTIFIKTYPKFDTVCNLENGDDRGYINVVFSESSLLITLGDLPDFVLTVWNWRHAEKIATSPGGIFVQNQIIKCNLSSPVFLAQLGIGTKRLHVWDIHICGKKCILTHHVVRPPQDCKPFTAALWTSEGALFVLDTEGSVYAMLTGHNLELVIDVSISGKSPTSFTWYRSGIAITGPDDEIRHYRKSGTWSIDWQMSNPETLKYIVSVQENLIALTCGDEIIQVLQTQNEFKYILRYGADFNDICPIYPVGRCLMTLCHRNMLSVLEMETGVMLASLKLNDGALVLVENPQFPYVAVGYDSGIVELISAFNPEKPVKIAQFFFMKQPINHIYFIDNGTVFVAANTNTGRFFIVEGLPGSQMEVIGTVDAQHQIANFMLVISQNCYRLFTIPVTSDKYIAGNKIVRYCVIKNRKIEVKEYHFEEPNSLYIQLIATTKQSRDRVFFAIPFASKSIHELEIKRGIDVAKVLRRIPTGHQMRKIRFKLDKRWALTWAFDGLVILRDGGFVENFGIGLPHHRACGGVQKAFVDPYGKYIVSLGVDGNLICTDLLLNSIETADRDENLELCNSPTYTKLFSRRTYGFMPRGDLQGKCYLEVQELRRIELERIQCKSERDSILAEFKQIQSELQQLLTINLEGPDNEKLDLREFNLDVKLYEEKSDYQKKLRKATEVYLRNLIAAQNRVSSFLLTSFWDTMQVPGTIIKAIFTNFDVANYVLLPPNSMAEDLLVWIKHHRQLERYFNDNVCFKPWAPIAEEDLIKLISEKPCYAAKDEDMFAITTIENDEELAVEIEDETLVERETRIAFSGSDVFRFIDIETSHYLQTELQTYFQAQLQWIISKRDSRKLRTFFNKEFDNIMMQKVKEMSNIQERNNRLRHIISEINYFSVDKLTIGIEDPKWEQEERPQEIRQVKNHEVPITPYISPSEQMLLDAKAAEAERIRLLLLADDFRERALMAMMNGVLEVRWEDELKKEVPLPKCMIEKQPENFNEDDLRAVRDYEDKVKFLNSERERYKSLLVVEYAKVANAVREGIRKFNGRLSDLLLLKLKIDAALSQETLKNDRVKLHYYTLQEYVKKKVEANQKIVDNDQLIDSLQRLLASLQSSIAERRSHADGLQVKDKFLEKSFRKDFQDMSLVVQEQATKLYKKRPKINIRSLSSATVLHELSKCITTNYRPLTLPADCIEFLKSLDVMDQYIGIPPAVDEATYHLICRHRRLRIEYEIKLRAANSDVAEAETTLAAFQRRLAYKKELGVKLAADLQQIQGDMLQLERNTEMQVVMPRGFIEIHMSGSLKDFEDAVLVCRKDVEDINKIILQFGNKKLRALQQTMAFRRRILAMEWGHKRLKMLIQDLREKIVDIHGVRLTKELQTYLKTKNKDKAIPFETEVDMIKASWENAIQDKKNEVMKMRKQINLIKSNDKIIDQKIAEANVDVCEFNLMKDHEIDAKEKEVIESRMQVLLNRTRLVQEIQEKHHEILVLQTELELLRLKTYPTIKYKVFS